MTRRISAAASPSRAEPTPGRSRPVHALVAGTIAFSLVITGTTVVSVALPAIGADFGSSVGALQWVSNAYTLLFGSLLLGMGAQADRRGARRIMLAGLAVFVAGAALAGLAPALGWLLAGQVLLGTGAAAMMPASLALISHAHPGHDERAHAIGIFASASAVAIGIGPVLGGVLIDAFGWRAVFALDIPVALAVGVLVARRLGETPLRPGHASDVPGTLLGIVALGSLTLGFIESGERGWTAPLTLTALAAAGVAGTAFIAVERRAASPMLPPALLAPLRFRTAVGAGVAVNFSVYGILFVLTLYLQAIRGYSPLETGLVFLFQIASAALTGLPASRWTGRRGPRAPTVLGCATSALGCIVLAGVGDGSSIALVVVGVALIGAGGGAAIPALTTAIVSDARREEVGTATAAFTAGRQIGAVLGVAVLGAMINTGDFTDGLRHAAVASAVCFALCGAGCAALLRPSTRVVP
jgi:DHA2 family methylenomycin A resistance protein-like MFS transporter